MLDHTGSSSFEPKPLVMPRFRRLPSGHSSDRAPAGTEEPQSPNQEAERTFDPERVKRITEDACRQVMTCLTGAMQQVGSPVRESIVSWFSHNEGRCLADLSKLLVDQVGLEVIIPALTNDSTDVVLDYGEIETALQTLSEQKKGS